MRLVKSRFDAALGLADRWLARHSVTLLRWALGAVFLGFGFLKFFPGVSPAEHVATKTTSLLTFGLVDPAPALVAVAMLECTIGLCLLSGRWLGLGLGLLVIAFVGILSPLVLLASELFTGPGNAPNLLGQYVLKDFILVAAALVVVARARGARLVPSRPDPADAAPDDLPTRRKLDIVLAGLDGGRSVSALCAENRVPEADYFRWRDELVDGVARTLEVCERDATSRQLLRRRIADAAPTAPTRH